MAAILPQLNDPFAERLVNLAVTIMAVRTELADRTDAVK
jgi:hypothetical protein